MFQDDSKNFRQFSSGIKTAIRVEPQGVVQFGSPKNILENTEFIDRTKRMPAISSSLPNRLFASLISSEDSSFGSGAHYSIDQTSLDLPRQSFSFRSQSQAMFLNNDKFEFLICDNSGNSRERISMKYTTHN